MHTQHTYRKESPQVKISLSDHFSFGRLLRFTFPSVIMMMFMSIYSIVDGYFVSNFAGQTALAGVNLVFPFIMMMASVGFMLGAGGSALVAKTLGEHQPEKALSLFSLFIYSAMILGAIMSVAGYFLMPSIITMVGGEGALYDESIRYGSIMLIGLVPFVLQQAFQTFFVTAGRPQIGLLVIVGAGVTNMLLDVLFVGVMKGGVAGAAWATVCSECAGGLLPLVYFFRRNTSTLRLGRTSWDPKALGRACTNGISELISQISMSFIGLLFNAQLLRFAGEAGVAAYSVLMYVNFFFVSAFIGYAVGTGPIVGYAFGAENKSELRSLLRKSLVIVGCMAIAMTAVAEFAGESIAKFFVGYDADLLAMTKHGFDIYSLSFLFVGFSIFTSGFFTGLNNGLISAIVSLSRTLGFELLFVLLLPELWGIDGIWLSVVVAEFLSAIVSWILLRKFRIRYGYGKISAAAAA